MYVYVLSSYCLEQQLFGIRFVLAWKIVHVFLLFLKGVAWGGGGCLGNKEYGYGCSSGVSWDEAKSSHISKLNLCLYAWNAELIAKILKEQEDKCCGGE